VNRFLGSQHLHTPAGLLLAVAKAWRMGVAVAVGQLVGAAIGYRSAHAESSLFSAWVYAICATLPSLALGVLWETGSSVRRREFDVPLLFLMLGLGVALTAAALVMYFVLPHLRS
jgi:hypothetical protein